MANPHHQFPEIPLNISMGGGREPLSRLPICPVDALVAGLYKQEK